MLRLTALSAVALVALGACSTAYRTHSVDQLRVISRNPDAQTGTLYAFSGRAVQVREDRGGTAFQVVVGEYYGEHSADFGESVVFYFPAQGADIIKGDRVSVLGRVVTEVSGRNAFGGRTSAVGMTAIAVVGPRKVVWLEHEGDTFREWEAGTLFAGH